MNEVKIHNLRTHQWSYQDIVNGQKTFDIRKNDRGFGVGDYLLLKETREIDNEDTGNEALVSVGYLVERSGLGLKDGYCVMGIDLATEGYFQWVIKHMFTYDEKLSILFEGFRAVNVWKAVTKEWTDDDWEMWAGLTKEQVSINHIRMIQIWFAEDKSKEKLSLLEQQIFFEEWMGW
jgi:ParB family chromosome partitioning protein